MNHLPGKYFHSSVIVVVVQMESFGDALENVLRTRVKAKSGISPNEAVTF